MKSQADEGSAFVLLFKDRKQERRKESAEKHRFPGETLRSAALGLTLVILLVLGTTGTAVAATLVLHDPTPASSDRFGSSVALFGNTLAVGAIYDDTGGSDAGAVFLFDATTGALLQTIANPTPEALDQFGSSVALSGNLLAVGAPGDDTGAFEAGSVYLFDATTGALLQTLANPTPAFRDFFGLSVAISGNMVAVGAPSQAGTTTDPGCAYLFNATTGALLQTIENPTPAADDRFGVSVAVSGNLLAVGAEFDEISEARAGSASLFDTTTGTLLRTIPNPAPARGDYFGYSVAMSGNTLVVAAINDEVGGTSAGAVHLFDTASGALLQTVANPTPEDRDAFGSSVSISGNTLAVGAFRDDAGAPDAGSAYLVDATSGALVQTLTNPTPADGDAFGGSVAVSGDLLAVGASMDDALFTDEGSAYVFDVPVAIGLESGWNLIGNPFPRRATVIAPTGRPLFVYNPLSGYFSTYTLQVGQGAWVRGEAGETLLFVASP